MSLSCKDCPCSVYYLPYSLLKKAKHLALPIDMQIDIFNKTVKPVLLYGCEIWGYGDLTIIERVQLKFLKYILNIKRSTPSCIVYGETGVTPISIDIKTRQISFWSKIITQDENKLTTKIYKIIHKNYTQEPPNTAKKFFGWLDSIRTLL